MKYTDPYNIAVIWLQNNPPKTAQKDNKTNKRGDIICHPDYLEIERLVKQYKYSIYVHKELEAYLINHNIMNISETK